MLRRKKARRLRVLESRRAEEIALDSARSGAPISPDATERQSAPTELTVAGGPKVRILLAPAGSQGELHELAMTRNRWFESISLQQTVCISPDFALPPSKAGLFRRVYGAEQAARSGETGVARRYGAHGGQYLCPAKFQYRSVDEAVS